MGAANDLLLDGYDRIAQSVPDVLDGLGTDGAAWRPDDATLERLAFPAADRRILAAAARAPELRAALDRAVTPSAVRRVLHREPVEAAVLAGGEQAARWIAEWRHARPEITGSDLLAAGLEGPAVGAGLEAAAEAQLDGRAPDRETQLAAALDAARRLPPRG